MRKNKKKHNITTFSLAFLDVISCAFGAAVLLLTFAKQNDQGEYADASQLSQLILAIAGAEAKVDELNGALSMKQQRYSALQQASVSNETDAKALEAEVARAQDNLDNLSGAASGLEDVLEQRQNAATRFGKEKNKDEEVGGIPVDSDYVIFIIDTSGSMTRHYVWKKVMKTLREVLNNHPTVKGFQVMTDNGDYLLSASKGKWRKDSKRQRDTVLRTMKNGFGGSSSSPLEGIEEALSTYAQKTSSLSLYVFGDDYTGGSFDDALAKVNQLNTNKRTGKKVARIHAVGFSDGVPSHKFATLMRAVAEQNNGSFINAL